jgi:cytoskeletal protein CcmA (bactofilin family)
MKKQQDEQIKAYMGEDTEFNGELSFEGTVRIDGKFEGKVTTEDIFIIGETGHVSAEIFAGTVVCMGRVEGTVVASKKIEIHSTSKVMGDVKSPAIYIELGGVLDGSCDMTEQGSKTVPLVKEKKEKKPLNDPNNG